MRFLDLFTLLILIPVAWAQAWSQGLPSLSRGSSLAVAKENDFLASPKGTFFGGFYEVGTNAYCFAIWFTNSVNKTVVWMANRDRPVNGRDSRLTLHGNGNLVLTDEDESVVWSTDTLTNAGVEARLLETGNLVLVNQTKGIIWESFEFPTDTLLPSQPFTKNPTLVSMRSRGTYLSGVYNMKFDDNNVLNLIFNGPLLSSVYWPSSKLTVFESGRTPYNSTRKAILNDFGHFESSDNFVFKATDYGVGPKRRLTLDYDGILRLYTLDDSTGLWKISWIPVALYNCYVHGLCGENGICVYSPQSTCICPDGFNRNDPSDWSKGCSPSFNLTCDPTKLDFMQLNNTDFQGYDLVTNASRISFEECRNRCLSDCKCKGFGYSTDGNGSCNPKGTLLNGYRVTSKALNMHIKILRGRVISSLELRKVGKNDLNCSNEALVLGGNDAEGGKTSKNSYIKYLIAFVSAFAVIEIICIGLAWCDSASKLDWNQRYNIAVGTARGLSYLHEECLEWTGHDTGFSKVRGTIGYLAPEWMMNQNIDAKADVYSYGVVLLELLSGKTASDFQSATPHDECNNLVQWATKHHMTPEGLRKVIDPRLKNESYEEKIDRMIEVALLCVAEDRHSRPPMSKVVELLTAYDESNPDEKRND
ncbi:hypothetical protein Patl1_31781 [Pistacia atlantica]|uniref:Uncharacterized protein n=1 Tax=Pistacia atlantica TaxID=434234 RepID=A0ACC1APP2_9ROSI|nr:hypothetical protein Patl1_31781 [Pistacia atlantica]